jgi:glycerophosphoryl diester phosphodiesterase
MAAGRAGADMCELDVRATRDGAIVVVHDDTVDRTTDGRGAVAAMTLSEIKRLDAGAWFDVRFRGERIPTLDEVLDAARGAIGLVIELKSDGIEPAVCELIGAYGAAATTIVSSFEWRALERVREIAPEVRVGLLAEDNAEAMLARASAMGAYSVHPRFEMVDRALCARARTRGLSVLVWTVDAPDAMRRMIVAGVDGIMTNDPERLREVIKSG